MRKHITKIITGIAVAAVLVVAYFLGGGSGSVKNKADPYPAIQNDVADNAYRNSDNDHGVAAENGLTDTISGVPGTESRESTGNAEAGSEDPASDINTDAGIRNPGLAENIQVSEGLQVSPAQPVVSAPGTPSGSSPQSPGTQAPGGQQTDDVQHPDEDDSEMTVTLIISVATLLDNIDKLAEGKEKLIPPDGIIFNGKAVFYEGESVFNVLLREVKKNRVHMEFANTPFYNSAYIEGINNIYEFDAGEGSGWLYSVNGNFPNYGCSRCILEDGDVVRWLFTCDRGADVGGADAAESYNWG